MMKRAAREVWTVVIQFHNHYLACELLSQSMPPQIVDFLADRSSDSLVIAKFGASAVELRRDNEPDRCFLVIGNDPNATFHLAIERPDLEAFESAWKQVVGDITQ